MRQKFTIEDPLLEPSRSPLDRVLRRTGGAGAAVVFHVLAGVFLVTMAPLCGGATEVEEEESVIDVAMFEAEPEPPEPEPEPEPPVPEPEPEVPEVKEPEPKPEPPKPEPKKKPPKIKRKPPKVQPEPPKEPPKAPKPAASVKPIDLSGMTMESMGKNGFEMKVGPKLGSKVTTTYIDPKKKVIVGDGNGDGSGSGSGNGTRETTPAPRRTCKKKRVKAIKLAKAPSTEYPAEAKRRGIEGSVIALLSIDKSGRVTGVKIVKKAGYGFDALAKKYMLKWKFAPAVNESCEKVASTARYTYKFSIDDF